MGFSILLTKLKTYAIAIAGAVIGVLLIALRVLQSQNSKLRSKARKAKATEKFAHSVMEQDSKAEVEEDIRLENAVKELNKDKESSELSKPNKTW